MTHASIHIAVPQPAPASTASVASKLTRIGHLVLRTARDVRAVAADAVAVAVPVACPGCGDRAGAPCPACAAALIGGEPVTIARPGGTPLMAAHRYADPVRQLLVQHKERGRTGLATPLGASLADAISAALRAAAPKPVGTPDELSVLLVPMPSGRAAVRRRGDDTVRALARVAARRLAARGVRARVMPALAHNRHVVDQVGLSRTARARNLSGALIAVSCPERWRGVPTVVVDDLVTTGATMREAERALRAAGYRVVAGAAVAVADRSASP